MQLDQTLQLILTYLKESQCAILVSNKRQLKSKASTEKKIMTEQ